LTKLELAAVRRLEFTPCAHRILESEEIRLEGVMSGISHGTELALYRGTSPFASRSFDTERRLFVDSGSAYPVALGYEWVGRVVETGAGVSGFRVGDLVHLPAPHAESHVCSLAQMGAWGVDGPLPGGIEPEAACFLSQISIAVQAVQDARILLGDSIIVFGLGVLGLFAVRLARLSGAGRVVAVDPLPDRRQRAEAWGADAVLDPRDCDPGSRLKDHAPGADIAIEFSGVAAALHQAIRTLRPGGRCVAAGFYQGGAAALNLGEEWLHNRITMVASTRGWGNSHRAHPRWDRARIARWAVELLDRGWMDPSSLVTRRRSYEEAPQVFADLDDRPEDSLKTLLIYGKSGSARK